MKLTGNQRQAMIGKRYSYRNFAFSATVQDIERCAGGFTVKYTYPGCSDLQYMGLQKFLKRFPHEI